MERSVKFRMWILKISRRHSRPPDNAELLVISHCLLAEDDKEMYQESKRTHTAIVLLIKPFV